MTSIDFAAAQQRVAESHQREAAGSRARLEARSTDASNALRRLPFPLQQFGQRGLNIWDAVNGREGTSPAFRVSQVDAELLDEELLELLRGQVGEGLKYFGQHIRDDWSPEILLALRAALFKLSMWDHNASYGATLQNLCYTDARHRGPVLVPPTRWQKVLYGIFTVGGRYGWSKWEDWLADKDAGYEEVIQDHVYRRAYEADQDKSSAKVRVLSKITSLALTTHSLAAFVSFLVFLVNGRYRTLLDRILRLRLAAPSRNVNREVSFEYLNRQLVWHAFTEFLLFFLPLVGISRWRRWLSRAWRKAKILATNESSREDEMSSKGELAFLPERTCAICYHDQNPTSTSENEIMAISGASGGVVGSAQTDITNPYETIPCGCVYCFVCLAKRLEAEEGEGWICLRCGGLVKECKPWSGDVLGASPLSANKKTVSFSAESEESQAEGEKNIGYSTSQKVH